MKKSVLVLVSGLCLGTFYMSAQNSPNVSSTAAQAPRKQHLTAEQRAQKSVDELDAIVGLSPDQKNKVYSLALNRAQSVDAIRQKYKGQQANKEQEKAEIKEIRKKYRQEIKSILTPQQLEKLKQHHQSKNPKGNPPVEEMIPNGSGQ